MNNLPFTVTLGAVDSVEWGANAADRMAFDGVAAACIASRRPCC